MVAKPCELERVRETEWFKALSRYERPSVPKALWQLADTLIPYAVLWYVMVRLVERHAPYVYTLGLAIPAAGFLVRIFIFFHDCCHGSFFPWQRANRIVGFFMGVLVFTPFDEWRHSHAIHHATSGDLERRGVGDVWTMTVGEYLKAPFRTRIVYRFYRNPIVLFLIAPTIMFTVYNRLPGKGQGSRERRSVYATNFALVAILIAAAITIGPRAYLLIQVPIIGFASSIGVWMFYVQHQYEKVYWKPHPEWDPIAAALAGSSFYKLPAVLQWFTGNIGFHHIHHLRPRIPNYNLQRCFRDVPALQKAETLTLLTSLKSMFLNVFDEAERRLVSFRALKRRTA
jgi:omega-6 fatty acid desaturase (delta-12 desaturase)